MARIDLVAEAEALLKAMDMGDMGPSIYDAAWVARLKDPGSGEPLFPGVLEWIRQSQHPDGSWGSEVEYYPDRIISTLAALVALMEHSPRAGNGRAIGRGLAYLEKTWPLVQGVPHLTVGFEVIVPTLLEEGGRLGLPLNGWMTEAQRMRLERLRRIPPTMIYSPKSTISFSLEFLGDYLDVARARETLLLPNGSIANAVASTAYFAARTYEEKTLIYLDHLLSAQGEHNVPFVHPFEVFERNWVLYNLHLAGLLDQVVHAARPHLMYLYKAWEEDGLSFSAECPLKDLDDTAIGYLLLKSYGFDVDAQAFALYERDDFFECYPFEMHTSVGTNAHTLHALTVFPRKQQEEVKAKVFSYLQSQKVQGAYWFDKWHVSPYYATAQVIFAVVLLEREWVEDSILWIESTQRLDGGWGFYGVSTVEETALALQGLLAYANAGGNVASEVIHRGASFLHRALETDARLPALWIGKGLYRPIHIIRSSILSALAMYEAWCPRSQKLVGGSAFSQV